MRKVLLSLAFSLLASLVAIFALSRIGYRLPDPEIPRLVQRVTFTQPLEIGTARDQCEIPATAGDFRMKGRLRIPERGSIRLLFRIAAVRKGIVDFEGVEIRSAGAEPPRPDAWLEPLPHRVEVIPDEGFAFELSARGRDWRLQVGEQELSGRARFAHGYFAFAGLGRVEGLELEPLGEPSGPFVPHLLGGFLALLLGLFALSALPRKAWIVGVLILLSTGLALSEAMLRQQPSTARAHDLLRSGEEAELLEAFGAYLPEVRNLDRALGCFTGELAVHGQGRRLGRRVAVIGFEAAGQEDRDPIERWYAPIQHQLGKALGEPVEVFLAFHPGARPSASLRALRPMLRDFGIELVLLCSTEADFTAFEVEGREPANEGWSSWLLLQALGLQQGPGLRLFEGDRPAFEGLRKELAEEIPCLEVEAEDGRYLWDLTGSKRQPTFQALIRRMAAALGPR